MKIKFMGTADEKHLTEDETIGGRLAEPLGVHVCWSRYDNEHNPSKDWVVDTDDPAFAEVDPDFWQTLVEEVPSDFRDVTEYKRVPLNAHQTTFLAMTEGHQKTLAEEQAEEEERRANLVAAMADDVRMSNLDVDLKAAKTKTEVIQLAKDSGLDVSEIKSSWTREEIEDEVRAIAAETFATPAGAGAVPVSPSVPSGNATGAGTAAVGGSTAGA